MIHWSGRRETPGTAATRIAVLDFDELPVAQNAASAPVPAPATVPDIAAAQPTAPAPRPTAPVAPAGDAATGGSQTVTEGVIHKGGCLAASFRRHDIPIPILTRVVREVGDVFDFTRSRPGDRYTVIRDSAGVLVAFRYVIGPGDELRVRRTGEDYTVIR